MDEFTKDLRLMEVISTSAGMNDARVELEDLAADGTLSGERWEGIRRHVFPLLDAERERLDAEYERLQRS
jgi:hypothetical protein